MSISLAMTSFDVWGHGDTNGSKRANSRLAAKRAKIVADEIARGFAGPHTPIIIHGPAEPPLPLGIENEKSLEDENSPVESSVEIYCSDGIVPSIDSYPAAKP